jgi:flavin-dependent dehydrogenase
VTGFHDLLEHAELVSDVKSASDWSYSALSYASPCIRIVGDAGCFIDPLFSAGVHLALMGGAICGGHDMCLAEGSMWRSLCGKLAFAEDTEAYTRFLLAVGSSYNQMMGKERPVLNEIDEHNFDRAFDMFRPSQYNFLRGSHFCWCHSQ